MSPHSNDRGLEVRRTFGSGVLVVGDALSGDVPGLGPGDAFAATPTLVAVAVRHGSAVEYGAHGEERVTAARVAVRCTAGAAPDDAVGFDGVIGLPSGLLSVGDADGEETLTLRPGDWRVQIACDPSDHPDRIRIWYSRATAESPGARNP